ncbi:MAG: TrpB-like pyridoxal phosphate-dependent enzyme [Dehalococcoidales bacterium]|nr:TrpB-like pyridoxal phosphate-dependent enzyme [Dehalococcoidales bacterium]
MRINPDIKGIPGKWTNIIPGLNFTVPPPVSISGFNLTHHDLDQYSSSPIIEQELDRENREIPIPEKVVDLYSVWRPTPMYRAESFERVLNTPAQIFYKFEGTSPSGGHEMNTAIPQAFYASGQKGINCIVSATGNGEWGSALANACSYFGLKCKIFMVRSSYEKKVYGRYIMEIMGAEVIPSPSDRTRTGKKAIESDPDSPGSIGMALSEAFETAAMTDDTKFAWGSVMNHVLIHQTVIGLEARSQLRKEGINPDIIISAVGGGSSFGGLVFPYYSARDTKTRMIAVESAAAPSLSRGRYAYDYADAEGFGPLLKMYTLGHGFVPPGIQAGDMRYHGMSPLISSLYREKRIEVQIYDQREAFDAALAFTRSEGLIPSPQSAYTLKAVVNEALKCKEKKEKKNILFVLDANSNLDLESFKSFVDGAMDNQPFPEKEVREALDKLPSLPSQ